MGVSITYRNRLWMLSVGGVLALGSPVTASLQIPGTNVAETELLAQVAVLRGFEARASSSSARSRHDDRRSAHRQQEQQVDLGHHHGAATSTNVTGESDGSPTPPLWALDAGVLRPSNRTWVCTFKHLVPPDPPPTGLLKPPRRQI